MLYTYPDCIGTYERPLELQPVSVLRELFKRVINDHIGGNNGYLFKDRYKNNSGADYFLINLSTNPVMTKSDIAIGAYLHLNTYLKNSNQDGLLYWTANCPDQNKIFFGESKRFWVKNNRGEMWNYPKPIRDLTKTLDRHNIKLTNETIIKSLRKLHACHFITMTTKHGLEVKSEDPKIRSEFRHICVYETMVQKPIYKHWKPKNEIDLSGINL